MIKYLYLLCSMLMLPGLLSAQDTEKSGWTVGGVPAISYNSDRGFQYGVVLELYNFGDGSDYPNYQQTIQGEWSRTTGGSGINEIFFDAPDFLWGKIRLTSYVGYRTELLQPFYGFGGYESRYNPAFVVSDSDDPEYSPNLYKSRFYYAHDRRYWSLRSDLQGALGSGSLRWVAGINFTGMDAGKPDIDEISSNLSFDDDIPDSSLYETYVRDGIIPADEARGGQVNYVKFGAIYDTRDTEANPMSGIWTELLFTTATEILGSDFNYTVATLTHRQYFTLIEEDLSFAYRLGIQSNIAGDTPFFMEP
ncbi:MAG: BamA/TamA family outer membrane protein, partial [Candidatus Marinimicrobia bacterium]|nr:BamA/TamA family outer membrane protein [Candidatus Neomarinimicrobiota bacterium]